MQPDRKHCQTSPLRQNAPAEALAQNRHNNRKMKKIIIAFLLISLSIIGFAQKNKGAVPKDRLMTLISEYSGKDGFDVVKIGSIGTSAMKTVLKLSAAKENDEDARKMAELMKGIKKMAIVDYESCNSGTRDTFNAKLEKILDSSELLMEMKDGDDIMKIYGIVDKDGTTLHDFVMYAPQDCALICMFGSIPMETVMKIAEK